MSKADKTTEDVYAVIEKSSNLSKSKDNNFKVSIKRSSDNQVLWIDIDGCSHRKAWERASHFSHVVDLSV